jgi:nitrogenase molybdenum-cofactor synthesis protein NifE
VALKATMPWLDINQERHHAYMGYVGMVKLMSEIDRTLFNPVWEKVRKPAPWEKPRDNWQARALAEIAAEEAELALDPVKAEEARRAKMICMCKSVTLGAIEDAISAHGLTSVAGVKEKTNASGGCGACSIKIEDILADGEIVGHPTAAHAQAAE